MLSDGKSFSLSASFTLCYYSYLPHASALSHSEGVGKVDFMTEPSTATKRWGFEAAFKLRETKYTRQTWGTAKLWGSNQIQGHKHILKLVTPWGWVVAAKITRHTNTCQTCNRARLSKGSEVLGQTCNNEALRGQWWSEETMNGCINYSCLMDAVAIVIY
jgi:hypothetical protein